MIVKNYKLTLKLNVNPNEREKAMIKLTKQIVLCTIAALLTINCLAQQKIVCRVIDQQTKEPIDSVTVFNKQLETKTNNMGYFSIAATQYDTLYLEKQFYEVSMIEVPANSKFAIMMQKRGETEYAGGWLTFRRLIAYTIHYPQKALSKRESGWVYASFDIDKHGQMQNIKLLNGSDEIFAEETINVLKKVPNNWQTTDHTETFVLPIQFQFEKSKVRDKGTPQFNGTLIEPLLVRASFNWPLVAYEERENRQIKYLRSNW